MISQASANLNIMIKAARKASRGLLRDFGEVENLQVSSKAAGDLGSLLDQQLIRLKTIRDSLTEVGAAGYFKDENGSLMSFFKNPDFFPK